MISIVKICRGAGPRRNVVVGGAALALAALPVARARAGVEYVDQDDRLHEPHRGTRKHIDGDGGGRYAIRGLGKFDRPDEPNDRIQIHWSGRHAGQHRIAQQRSHQLWPWMRLRRVCCRAGEHVWDDRHEYRRVCVVPDAAGRLLGACR